MTDSRPLSGTVLVTSRSFSSGTVDLVAALAETGLSVVRGDVRHDPAELAGPLADAVAWIAGTSPVTAELLDLAPRLTVVARYGVGVDAVDLTAAAARNVQVTNTPGANTDSVAELALALLLGALRKVAAGDAAVRSGDWTALRGGEIGGLDIGVVGFGRIGRGFATRAAALGATIAVFDPFLPAAAVLPDGMRRVGDLADLAACGAVSLHAGSPDPMIGTDWLAAARGAILVNTARAHLVDEAAVAAALTDGRLQHYAADSLAGEFATASTSPLLAEALRDRVTITPHLGAQTTQAIDRMGGTAVANVLAVLRGQAAPNPVAAPTERTTP